MSVVEILIVGLALSMDAFAVTITNVMSYPSLSRARRLVLPLTFGIFQGLMLLVGYLVGGLAIGYIKSYAGPVALIILVVIGGRMIFEAVRVLRKKSSKAKVASGENSLMEARAEAGPPLKPETSAAVPDDTSGKKAKTLSFLEILVQGVATSLDALIVGVSLVALGTNIFLAAPIVGLTTLLVCLIGLALGRRVGALLGDKAQIVGGIILILIGIKACFF